MDVDRRHIAAVRALEALVYDTCRGGSGWRRPLPPRRYRARPKATPWRGALMWQRLVPNETDVVAGDRADLAPLANALVEARLLTHSDGTLEIAHETLLRRQAISVWLEEHKDALKRGALYLRPPLGLTRADGGRPSRDPVTPQRAFRLPFSALH